MSAILEQSPNPAAPAAPAAPAVIPPTPEELTLAQELAAHNAAVAEETGLEPESDQIATDDSDEIAEYVPPPDEDAEEVVADEPVEGEEEKPAEEKKEGEPEPELITFDPAAETPETYVDKKTKVIESYGDNLPADLKSLLDYQETKYAEAQAAIAEFDGYGDKETVLAPFQAIDRAYEPEIVDGQAVLNPAPVVEMFRTKHAALFSPLANRLFEADSLKYQGASVFEEVLIDRLGEDKARAIGAFAAEEVPLPTLAPELRLPSVVNEASKEAYFKLPEVKRFEIVSLGDEITRLQGELEDASEYYKGDLRESIGKAQEKLKAELFAIDQIQNNINNEREQRARADRQQSEQKTLFRNKVNTAYNTEIFTMADDFAKMLAPNLTFADTDTQLSQARNINARVGNALGFMIQDDGSITPDPLADHYAKQLTEEGVKYDFAKGRELLQRHYQATEKLELLRNQNADSQAIAKAERTRNALMLDIKTEQRQLLGQLSAKYVNSTGKALEKQVNKIKGDKQIAKKVTNGRAYTGGKVAPTLESVDAEIARANQAARNRIKDGDDLFDDYQNL